MKIRRAVLPLGVVSCVEASLFVDSAAPWGYICAVFVTQWVICDTVHECHQCVWYAVTDAVHECHQCVCVIGHDWRSTRVSSVCVWYAVTDTVHECHQCVWYAVTDTVHDCHQCDMLSECGGVSVDTDNTTVSSIVNSTLSVATGMWHVSDV